MTRPSWGSTWMQVAETISRRSRCDRANIGAVIVGKDQRIVSTGYNGPPADFPVAPGSTCRDWCSRASQENVGSSYEGCPAVHAEMNAIAYADRSKMEGGAIYVTGAVCWDCAKVIANSGISEVTMRVRSTDQHRNPEGVIAFLRSCGLEVTLA